MLLDEEMRNCFLNKMNFKVSLALLPIRFILKRRWVRTVRVRKRLMTRIAARVRP